jgi:hypothetical protein
MSARNGMMMTRVPKMRAGLNILGDPGASSTPSASVNPRERGWPEARGPD